MTVVPESYVYAHLAYRSNAFRDLAARDSLDRRLLAQSLVCTVPAMVLILVLGDPRLAAYWLYATLSAFFLLHGLTADRRAFVALLLSCLPSAMLLRSFFAYNSLVVFLAAGVVHWWVLAPVEVAALWRRMRWPLSLAALYWFASYLWTGEYFANLRVLELLLSASCVFLLSKHPATLATALWGLAIGLVAMGIALLPYGERLGLGTIGSYQLGNPVSFGIPLALVLLLTIVDNGRWLLFGRNHRARILTGLTASTFILLSTSRGSWLIVIFNLLMLLLISRRERWRLLLSLAALAALLALVTVALLRTERGAVIAHWFDKTVSSDKTMVQRTSGRTDQWGLFPYVLMDSPIIGCGPGTGSDMYAYYSKEVGVQFNPGKAMAWHSLYLHVGVEMGLVGLAILGHCLWSLFHRAWRCRLTTGWTMPLVGAASFAVIAGSVSGFDAVSGLFLGMALVSYSRPAPFGH